MAYKQEIVLTKWIRQTRLSDYEFIADKIMSVVDVTAPGKYYLFERKNLRLLNDQVTIDGNSPTIETGEKYAEGTFAPVEYAVNTYIKVNENDVLNRSAQQRLELKTKDLALMRRFNKEYQMKALLDTAVNSVNASVAWDGTSPVIEKDIRDAISTFRTKAGVQPNTMIIPLKVWNVMVMDSLLSQRWTLLPGRKNQDIELESLMGYLFKNIKKIFVPVCMYDSGQKGDEIEKDLWDVKSVYLLYVGGDLRVDPDTEEEEFKATETTFTWASIFRQKKETVGSWLSPNGKIKYVELTEAYDMKLVCENAVLRIDNVLT